MIPLQLPLCKPQEVKHGASWRVVLPMPVYSEMMHYVQSFKGECSGAGLVEVTQNAGEQVFTITRLFLPLQHNTDASTDIEEDEVGKLVTRLVREGAPVEQLRFHWHSHANMDVFHSGTDEDNYKVLQTGDFLVSIVANKAGKIKASVHYYKPFKLTAENIPVTVQLDNVAMQPAWDENIALVQAHEAERKTKQYSALDKWREDQGKKDVQVYDKGGYQCKWKKEGEMSCFMLSEMLRQMYELTVLVPAVEKWSEGIATVLDNETMDVYKFTLNVEHLREATPADVELAATIQDYAGYPTKEDMDNGAD